MKKYNLEEIMKIAVVLDVYLQFDNDKCHLVYSSEHIEFGEGYLDWLMGFTHDQQPENTVYFCNRLIDSYNKIMKSYGK